MEKLNKSEEAAYAEGFRKGLRRGIIGAVIGSVFGMVAYDLASDVISGTGANVPPPRHETLEPKATQYPPRMNPPA